MSGIKIRFRCSDAAFVPATQLSEADWSDTSFSRSSRAVGDLRFPSVDNGRYPSKHPILDTQGATVGFLHDGQSSLGYTFKCVYAGSCFWIAHQGFSATMHGGGSSLSIVSATGVSMFSSNLKFGVVKSFGFDSGCVHTIRAFKLLDDGASLLYLTNYGICLFDTRKRDIVAKVDFANIAYQWSGFALSPKVHLLAIGSSVRGDKDPLDGGYCYRNSVRIYDLDTGSVVGEQVLAGDREIRWNVDFSENGRQLRVAEASSAQVFELSVDK